MERETGFEPATSSLGKCYYFDSQGFSGLLRAPNAMEFPQFPGFGREWNHNGISEFHATSKNYDASAYPYRGSCAGSLVLIACCAR